MAKWPLSVLRTFMLMRGRASISAATARTVEKNNNKPTLGPFPLPLAGGIRTCGVGEGVLLLLDFLLELLSLVLGRVDLFLDVRHSVPRFSSFFFN